MKEKKEAIKEWFFGLSPEVKDFVAHRVMYVVLGCFSKIRVTEFLTFLDNTEKEESLFFIAGAISECLRLDIDKTDYVGKYSDSPDGPIHSAGNYPEQRFANHYDNLKAAWDSWNELLERYFDF